MSEDNKKVVHMGILKHDGSLLTPYTTLNMALEDIGEGKDWHGCKKLMVIFLDDEDDMFEVGWRQCGMKMSECLALLKVAEIKVLRNMELIENSD